MWATFIGSTFCQVPVPGERKSGIPDGTEMPAPVSATTESASRTSSASRAISREGSDIRLCPANRGARLARNAEMPSRASSLASTLANACLLGGDAGVDVACAGDALDLLDRQRRLRRQPPRPRQGGVEQFVILDHAVDEPQLERLLGEDRIADRGSSPAPCSRPTSRGRRCVPPKPGMIPSLISGWPNSAERAAMRTSQAIASSQPPPKARPLTAAIVATPEVPISRSSPCMPSQQLAPGGSRPSS